MTITQSQHEVLALMPKFTAPLSIMGSSLIIADILRSRNKRQRTYPRLMLGMSCFDVVVSSSYFMSTWPIPSWSSTPYSVGTVGSCSTQGFFNQLVIATPLYNLCLAIYYLLVVAFKWSERRIKNIEFMMHGAVLSFSFCTAIAGIPLNLYNDAITWCWIESVPRGCAMAGTECIRGSDALTYQWAFIYGPLWSAFVVIAVSMSYLYYFVRREEQASARWRRPDGKQSLANQVFWQGFFYCFSFYLTWVFPTIAKTMPALGTEVPFAIALLQTIFLPLQGLLNSFVYIRPRFINYLKKNPASSYGRVIGITYLGTLFRSRWSFGTSKVSEEGEEREEQAAELDPAHAYLQENHHGFEDEGRYEDKEYDAKLDPSCIYLLETEGGFGDEEKHAAKLDPTNAHLHNSDEFEEEA